MEDELVQTIVRKCRDIRSPERALSHFLSRDPEDLREVVGWLMAHGYDTFICREVVALLSNPINHEIEQNALLLRGVFSDCLSSIPCKKSTDPALTLKACAHIARRCNGRHLKISPQDELFSFLRLLSLIFDASQPLGDELAFEARGGGSVQKGEVSAMGVQTRIKDTYRNRGHQSDMIKKSKLNPTLMFAVAKMAAIAAGGRSSQVVAVCSQGRHRSRMVSSVSAVAFKALCHARPGVSIHAVHNGR